MKAIKEKKGGAVPFDKKPFFLLQTSDINDYLNKRDKGFMGVYSKKDLPVIKNKMMKRDYSSIVCNIDDDEGTHWVSLIYDNGQFYWIDPLGAIPPKIAIQTIPDLKYNTDILQDVNGAECGLYAIKLILEWSKSRNK